jgi:hypothetical protein
MEQRLRLIRNVDAETVFRTLGSLVRVHPADLEMSSVSSFLARQPMTTDRAARHAEQWTHDFYQLMRGKPPVSPS